MNPYNYPPSYEEWLRDEVIYLHSLWYRGPPSNPYLKPHFPPPSFNKKNKKKKSGSGSDKEWPVNPNPPSPSPSGSSWPAFKPRYNPAVRPATAEEQASIMALKVQERGSDSVFALFKKKKRKRESEDDGEDGDDDDEGEDDDGDDDVMSSDDDDDDDGEESEEFGLFLKVFEGDEELSNYYKKNSANGDFYCLVCGVRGKKNPRRYKNCVALVQHSVTIAKTMKRKAHRAYGHAICNVLGWDINHLPSMEKASELQDGDSANAKNEEAILKDIDKTVDQDNKTEKGEENSEGPPQGNVIAYDDERNGIKDNRDSMNVMNGESLHEDFTEMGTGGGANKVRQGGSNLEDGSTECQTIYKEGGASKNLEAFNQEISDSGAREEATES